MNFQEILEAVLRLCEIFTEWPVIFLVFAILFKKQVADALSRLSPRLKKAEILGNKFEFSELQKAASNALSEAIEEGVREYKEKPEQLTDYVKEQTKKFSHFYESQSYQEKSHLDGCSILWVDDNFINNLYESKIFTKLGANITFARSSDEAFAFLRHDHFDVIISDVKRGSNHHAGYEFLEKIQQKNYEIPVIFYISNVAFIDKEKSQFAYSVTDDITMLAELAVSAFQFGSTSRRNRTRH
ncbi:MAG: response regulator [Cyanobacteria bacterium SBLK]|nr:response regulator [Cyanobacteria bacterium SBLK]